jgi:hypothetical protein
MKSIATVFLHSIVLCFFLAPYVGAQDLIIMRNGDEIKARVEEVGQAEIKYKKFENLTGPTYTVHKSDVFMIRYENGQRDVFQQEQPRSPVNTGNQFNPTYTSSDIARTRSAAIVGYIAIAPVLGLAVGAAAADDGTALGGVATLIFGVTLPVVAGSSSKLRDRSGVTGSPGLRLAGWIGYGFTMVDAIVAVGLGASDIEVPDGTVIALGVLGGASLAMISAEANTTARQAEERMSARHIRIKPTLGYTSINQGKLIPTVGIRIGF